MLLVKAINNKVFTACDISELEYITYISFFSCAIKKTFLHFLQQKHLTFFKQLTTYHHLPINVLNI